MDKNFFIIYLTTSGAGTHIIRSLMMDLYNQGKIGPIDHHHFWAKATAAIYFPNEISFHNNEKNNSAEFEELCQKFGINTQNSSNINKERVFNIFEEIYGDTVGMSRFDFTRLYTTSEGLWTQKYIDSLHELLIQYVKSKNRKVKLKFIVQIRNPLDHIASLSERFKGKNSQVWRDNVLNNLNNIEKILPRLSKDDYVFFTLDDIILKYDIIKAKINKIIGLEVSSNFYLSSLSLNKWYSCPRVFKCLDDKFLISKSKDYGYNYWVLPRGIRFLYFLIGFLKREMAELKVVVDLSNNRVNTYNSIGVKHAMRGMLPRLYLLTLKLSRSKKWINYKKYVEKYHQALISHNAND